MPILSAISDPRYVAGQYRSAVNINTRIGLHEAFSTNPYGWQRWIFDHLHLPVSSAVLELGCGSGRLWTTNLERIPVGWQICLSDLSAGMLEQARTNLGQAGGQFEFRQIDAQTIPFPDGSFDAVIANHMLYHVPNPNQALREIKRVLKKDGCLYASTVGRQHLLELRELLTHFSPALKDWGVVPGAAFTLENGARQLAVFFPQVKLDCYNDALRVTQAEPLIEYVCSGRADFNPEEKSQFIDFIRQELTRQGGSMFIRKDSGLFQAATLPVLK